MIKKDVSRRSLLKWTGALAAAGVVGIGLGFGGDLLIRPSVTSTSTTTATSTLTGSKTTVTAPGTTATTTVTASTPKLSYIPPLSAPVQLTVNTIVQDLVSLHEGETTAYTICTGSQCWRCCPVKVHIKNGVVTAFEPDDTINVGIPREDQIPNAIQKGLIQYRGCSQAYSWLAQLYNPNRVLYPMQRVGNRGEGQFQRIDWTTAMQTFANMVSTTVDKYGPLSVYSTMFSFATEVGQWYNAGVNNGWGAYSGAGVSNCANWVRQPSGGAQDLANYFAAKLIILWGYSTNYQQGEMAYYLSMAREQGIPIISIEPRYTDTTEVCANQWIPIRPSTDVALAIAIANVWFKAKSYDQTFVSQYVEPTGFQKWQDYVTGVTDGVDKNEAWAAGICGVPAATITALANLWINSKPVNVNMSWACGRAFWGQNTSRALIYLAAMSGNLGIPGTCDPTAVGAPMGVSVSSTPAANWQRAAATYTAPTLFEDFKWQNVINLYSQYAAGKLTAAQYNGQIGGLATNTPPNIHMIINMSNQIQQVPDTSACIEAFKALDYVVSISQETYRPTALYTDLLLPQIYSWFEGMNCDQLSYTDRFRAGRGGLANYFAYIPHIVEPPGEVMMQDWIVNQLAQLLGVGNLQSPLLNNVPYDQWESKIDAIEGEAYQTWTQLSYIAPTSPPSWTDFKQKPVWRYEISTPAYSYHTAGGPLQGGSFTTASGKIEFYSNMIAQGPNSLANYNAGSGYSLTNVAGPSGVCYGPGNLAPMAEFQTGGVDNFYGNDVANYPILLSSPHSLFRQHSFNDNNTSLAGELYRHAIWLSVADANARGIKDGDTVHVFNDIGEMLLPAYVTSRVVPGSGCIYEGGWYTPDTSWGTTLMPDGIDTRGSFNFLSRNDTVPTTIVDHLNCKASVQVDLNTAPDAIMSSTTTATTSSTA